MINNTYFKDIKSPKMTKKSKILPLVDTNSNIVDNSGIYKKCGFHMKIFCNCKFCTSNNGG